MSESFEQELLQRLTAIETKMDSLSYNPAQCAVHEQMLTGIESRVDVVETQQGKQNLVAVSVGAISAGIVLAVKYLVFKAGA